MSDHALNEKRLHDFFLGSLTAENDLQYTIVLTPKDTLSLMLTSEPWEQFEDFPLLRDCAKKMSELMLSTRPRQAFLLTVSYDFVANRWLLGILSLTFDSIGHSE